MNHQPRLFSSAVLVVTVPGRNRHIGAAALLDHLSKALVARQFSSGEHVVTITDAGAVYIGDELAYAPTKRKGGK